MNVYPFIDAEKRQGSAGTRGGNVKRSCELLGVSLATPPPCSCRRQRRRLRR
jgi:hypothetical protein